jgi:hypothetical protein
MPHRDKDSKGTKSLGWPMRSKCIQKFYKVANGHSKMIWDLKVPVKNQRLFGVKKKLEENESPKGIKHTMGHKIQCDRKTHRV